MRQFFCFGGGCKTESPRRVTTASPRVSPRKIAAATTIQRIYRGGAARTALRTGTMKRNVRRNRTTALLGLKATGLPLNMRERIMKQTVKRVPANFNKKPAPKRTLSPSMQQWLRTVHGNARMNEHQYNAYVNRVYNLQESRNRASKVKAILARYELLKPLGPNAVVTRDPAVIRWRRLLLTNFKRKFTPRHNNTLSSRELYAFLQTVPMVYLTNTLETAPTYA